MKKASRRMRPNENILRSGRKGEPCVRGILERGSRIITSMVAYVGANRGAESPKGTQNRGEFVAG